MAGLQAVSKGLAGEWFRVPDGCDDGHAQRRVGLLRWRDADWNAARIRIGRNYTRGESGIPRSPDTAT